MKLIDGRFFNLARNAYTSVYAVRKGTRWQYRMDSPAGKLIASGMTPAAFVKSFWGRDDYQED